jgi:CRISPR type III-A-associated protein Csm2
MNNMGDAFEKAGVEREKPKNTQNRPQQGRQSYGGGQQQRYNNEDLTIDFKNGYDPVKEGEKLINKMKEIKRDSFTTSQLRKIHAYASIVNNKLQMEESNCKSSAYKISEVLQNDIQYIKLKLIYQMGREISVKKWFGAEPVYGVKGIGLEKIISDIGDSKEKFDKFYRLMESIIAYRKYLIKE